MHKVFSHKNGNCFSLYQKSETVDYQMINNLFGTTWTRARLYENPAPTKDH